MFGYRSCGLESPNHGGREHLDTKAVCKGVGDGGVGEQRTWEALLE